MNQAAYRIDGQLVERADFYAVACDPARSVAVEACAGAGKTWMLVSRILRALLDGAAPQDILAITFTKKAAGEMRQRLQDWLRAFAALDESRLAQELILRGMSPAEAPLRAADLGRLNARLLAAGRPVQIRTFHSWFASLLRGAPLAVLQELDLPADHELLEDDTEAVALVWPRFYAAVAADPGLRQDFMDNVARHGRHQTLKALTNALNKRTEFALADQHGIVDASVEPFAQLYPRSASLDRPEQALSGVAVRERWHAWSAALGAEKNKTPQNAAHAVVDAFAGGDDPTELSARLAALRKAFFVATEDRLSNHLAKYPAAQAAEAELQDLLGAVRQHQAWELQQRLARLTRCLIGTYRELKRERGWVDMNDVESAARRLLGDAELSGWMQQRLDARVRHLLIDEFQDTNPLQWQALYGWLSGYGGAGAGDAPAVFLVGDPKQSIYRFRRAEPQVFKAAQAFLVSGLGGAMLSCDHTRRCATGVIDALNAVMDGAAQDAGYTGFRPHTTESHEPGAVLALPVVERENATDAPAAAMAAEPAWRDSLQTPRVTPEDSLSRREAGQAADWIVAQMAGGQLQPHDLMVLSRKRERLGWMHEALAERGIAAEQPEKLDLAEAPAVQDVTALLDALVSPAHDLSLARALRSPIFGLGDAGLARLARLVRRADAQAGRGEGAHPRSRTTWWTVLQALNRPNVDLDVSDDPAADALLADAATRLARWRAWLDALPPHDALAAIYRDGDLLARYAAAMPDRLREPVLASLRALMAHSLSQDGGRYLTAYRLVRALKAGGIRLHAPAQAQAVRLLTIHGAKGLEAHTVLMLDTDAAPPPADTMGVLVDWPGEASHPQRFVFLASEKNPPACAVNLLAAEQQARALEELNALYVAITRAEQRIVISSVQPHRQPAVPSWRRRIEPVAAVLDAPAPAGVAQPDQQPADCRVWDLPANQTRQEPSAPTRPAPPEDDLGARLGLALHRLLQWVPTPLGDFAWGEHHRVAVAREFGLTPEQARQAQDTAQAVISGQAAWAWDAEQLNHWGNEVDVWADGQLQRLDRLVRRRDTGCWWVLDYKSALRPELQAPLREQLQRYHRALSLAHPGDPVRLAFINARGELIEMPADPLERSHP